jgi:hypothetical protein
MPWALIDESGAPKTPDMDSGRCRRPTPSLRLRLVGARTAPLAPQSNPEAFLQALIVERRGRRSRSSQHGLVERREFHRRPLTTPFGVRIARFSPQGRHLGRFRTPSAPKSESGTPGPPDADSGRSRNSIIVLRFRWFQVAGATRGQEGKRAKHAPLSRCAARRQMPC